MHELLNSPEHTWIQTAAGTQVFIEIRSSVMHDDRTWCAGIDFYTGNEVSGWDLAF